MRHLMSPLDLSKEELEDLLTLASDIEKNPKKYAHVCDDKRLATCFYEPSTRTRLSFEAAMKRLGGEIIGFSEPNSSSVSKGESLADTMRVVSGYVDVIVMRHPIAGAAEEAINYTSVPFINAGDGGNQHPTQTLTDLLTIKTLTGRLDNHVIGLCGDLKYGRTVHSLVRAMNRYNDSKFVFIAPEQLRMPGYVKQHLKNHVYYETASLDDAIPSLDLLYMTRIQKERFADLEEYELLKDCYRLDAEKMNKASENMLVMHPLPRVNEIATEVDDDKRAVYFQQAKFGMYVRMALIMKLLGVDVEE